MYLDNAKEMETFFLAYFDTIMEALIFEELLYANTLPSLDPELEYEDEHIRNTYSQQYHSSNDMAQTYFDSGLRLHPFEWITDRRTLLTPNNHISFEVRHVDDMEVFKTVFEKVFSEPLRAWFDARQKKISK